MRSNIITKVAEYWDRASCGTNRAEGAKYSLQYFDEIEEFRYEHEPFIHSFAQFTRWHGKKVLEVGMGAGTDFLQFVRAGARAYGVDLTQESISNVESRLKLYGLSAEDVRACNAECLPYEDNSFDLVYSWGVIHHADDMERVLAEIYRVAKAGGGIKVMVYNANALYTWYKYIRHAILTGNVLKGRRWAICNYQESYGTKVYSKSYISRLLRFYKHSNLKFYFWDQYIRRGAKCEKLRRIIHGLTPSCMRWYMAFEFTKLS